MSSGCKQSQRSRGGKNKITSNEGGAPIIVVKLLRTDTTLDLSQKARVVKISGTKVQGFYSLRALRTDHLGTVKRSHGLPGAAGLLSSGSLNNLPTPLQRILMPWFMGTISLCVHRMRSSS
jgi:hypothetical protein